MQEQGIIRLCIRHQPTHCAQYIRLRWLGYWILLIIGQDNHVFPTVPISLNQKGRDIPYVIDTASQLALLAKIVYADEQSLAFAGTVGILKGIAIRGAVAELLLAGRRWRGTFASVGALVGVLVAIMSSRRAITVIVLRVLIRRGILIVVTVPIGRWWILLAISSMAMALAWISISRHSGSCARGFTYQRRKKSIIL